MPVEQMNVSLSPQMARYVRKQVKSGSYTNISEVVRTAIRRLQEDEAREARTAQSRADVIINELTDAERIAARRAVQAGLDSFKRGDYVTYEGRAGLDRLASEVKARGRRAVARKASRG
jgi:putative addiction module CopG family antidote